MPPRPPSCSFVWGLPPCWKSVLVLMMRGGAGGAGRLDPFCICDYWTGEGVQIPPSFLRTEHACCCCCMGGKSVLCPNFPHLTLQGGRAQTLPKSRTILHPMRWVERGLHTTITRKVEWCLGKATSFHVIVKSKCWTPIRILWRQIVGPSWPNGRRDRPDRNDALPASTHKFASAAKKRFCSCATLLCCTLSGPDLPSRATTVS